MGIFSFNIQVWPHWHGHNRSNLNNLNTITTIPSLIDGLHDNTTTAPALPAGAVMMANLDRDYSFSKYDDDDDVY